VLKPANMIRLFRHIVVHYDIATNTWCYIFYAWPNSLWLSSEAATWVK